MQSAREATGIPTTLLEHEFDLPGQIVAGVALTQAVLGKDAHFVTIDALLLDH